MKKNFYYSILLWSIIVAPLFAQQYNNSLGVFQSNSDVGNVKLPGKTVYDSEKQIYVLEGAGANIWYDQDEFQYAWKKIKGDFILTAQVEFLGEGIDPHRKLGWMVRQSLDASSPHVSAVIHGDGLTSLQYRTTLGENMSEKKLGIQSPNVVQLMRNGNIYTMSVARFGDIFVSEQLAVCGIPDEAYVGIFVCSHNLDVREKALFRNVRIEIPAADTMVVYRDFLGSNLETLNVFSGERRILEQFPNSVQAPNWTPDDKYLIYNSEGLLYTYDLASGKIEQLNTGSATGNNNDHAVTFDGQYIGISSNHDPADKGQSAVYYLPITGGEPMKVTQKTPSYFHGWSPDGKEMAFIGQRKGNFDVYKISREGGNEIRLTTAEGLDDGSEYTPDGSYIYFNSVRTGTMQIWRMKPDGSDQEQVTHDPLNNWFPHISPDGKWIVFITFGNDVDPSDHPFYKHVYLRMMPTSGGKPKVVAYLYGGQGTMNVPSWSPDSRKIAFVSNSGGIE
jgi:TolB protein